MSVILVKHSKSLPVSFVQREGDASDIRDALNAHGQAERARGVTSERMLRILGRHWDTLQRIVPDDVSDTALPGGAKAWTKQTALPVLRSMCDAAAGNISPDEQMHDALKQYYSVMAQGLLYGVDPKHPEHERLRTWTEYREAIAEHRTKEPTFKAIVRGFETIIRKTSSGYTIPKVEDCAKARPFVDDITLRGMCQVMAHMAGKERLMTALSAVDIEAIEHADYLESVIAETE